MSSVNFTSMIYVIHGVSTNLKFENCPQGLTGRCFGDDFT